jgi:hypothetical protein
MHNAQSSLTQTFFRTAPIYNTILIFGSPEDRVIETAGIMPNNQAFELGYYNGNTKAKAIINISSALGCPIGCNFCELTDTGRNLTVNEMLAQISFMATVAKAHDGNNFTNKPLKVNIAKTGEPMLNPNIPEMMNSAQIVFPNLSYKYSTVMPDIKFLRERFREIACFAKTYKDGSVQIQISLISTNEEFRRRSTRTRLASFARIREALEIWRDTNPDGRTANCSLLVGNDTPCDPAELRNTLPPELINLRIRKIISTAHSRSSGIEEASKRKVEDILHRFQESGYNINDAGLPTPTEEKYQLASNVTRANLMQGKYDNGILFFPS